ncbi:hypothetical protein SLS64_002955 [Diaporthe eres]
MEYPFECVLSKQYKDPEKISEKLNEFLGEDGWNQMKIVESQYVIKTKKELTEEQKKEIEEFSKNHY